MIEEAQIKYVRKRLYVTDKAPALSVDFDGYVRCGLSQEMSESDMLVLGLVLSMQNADWKTKLIERDAWGEYADQPRGACVRNAWGKISCD